MLLGAAVGAGREDLDDADRGRRAAPGAATGSKQGSVGSGCGHLTGPFVGRAGAGWARRPRPTRTCRARRRAGSRAGACPGRQRPLDVGVDHDDAGRQVARVGVDAGVVVEVAVRRLEVDAGGDPPAADGQERQAERAVRARTARTGAGRRRGSGRRPAVGGKRPSAPQRFWWRSMNASRSASGSGESSSRISPTASARRTLRRISWRSFLPRVAEVVVHRRAVREGHDRADVLALEVERPALGHLAGTEGGGQRVGGRVAAAQPAQVDDVPVGRAVRLGEVGRERRRRRPAGRSGAHEDRRVVGVVRGPEEDRRGVGRRPASASASAPWRIVVWVSASLGSTSWRCMSGTIATGSAVPSAGASAGDDDERLLVGVRAVGVPPGPVERPAENGVAHGVRAARASQVARGMSATARGSARRRRRGRTGPRRRRPDRPPDRQAPGRGSGEVTSREDSIGTEVSVRLRPSMSRRTQEVLGPRLVVGDQRAGPDVGLDAPDR